MKEPVSLQQAIQYFSDPDNCLNYVVARRWPKGVICPTCGSSEVKFIPTRRLWECKGKHAKRQFSAKVGTIMEDSAISLDKWLIAMWMVANCRNGVSSYEIHRTIKVTQKSAWFMLHRIRLAMQQNAEGTKMGGPGGEVEADESFYGGKAANMHKDRRAKFQKARENNLTGDTRLATKVAIMGILDRNQRKIRATIIPSLNRETLQAEILRNVEYGTRLYTDEAKQYRSLSKDYIHAFVNHAEKYVEGRVHTNGLENFWSCLKRGLNGTYVAVEPFHLFRYVDEQVFRYNHRKDRNGRKLSDLERFEATVSQVVGKRLTYAELTGKVGDTTPF